MTDGVRLLLITSYKTTIMAVKYDGGILLGADGRSATVCSNHYCAK